MAIRDPLFDKKKPQAVTAGVLSKEEQTLSPISGQPMTPMMCKNIPVMVDLPNRVVVPVFDFSNSLS